VNVLPKLAVAVAVGKFSMFHIQGHHVNTAMAYTTQSDQHL
jgi:hypothetical protein